AQQAFCHGGQAYCPRPPPARRAQVHAAEGGYLLGGERNFRRWRPAHGAEHTTFVIRIMHRMKSMIYAYTAPPTFLTVCVGSMDIIGCGISVACKMPVEMVAHEVLFTLGKLLRAKLRPLGGENLIHGGVGDVPHGSQACDRHSCLPIAAQLVPFGIGELAGTSALHI